MKAAGAYLAQNKKDIMDIGVKCSKDKIFTPVECFNKYGEKPAPPKWESEEEEADGGIGGLLGLAKNMSLPGK